MVRIEREIPTCLIKWQKLRIWIDDEGMVHYMPVIYLNERRHLTKEQKEMAKVALENEVNEIMADLEIMEEELDKTSMFSELDLRGIASEYLKQRVKKNTDGSYDEELLKRVYRWYFQE